MSGTLDWNNSQHVGCVLSPIPVELGFDKLQCFITLSGSEVVCGAPQWGVHPWREHAQCLYWVQLNLVQSYAWPKTDCVGLWLHMLAYKLISLNILCSKVAMYSSNSPFGFSYT